MVIICRFRIVLHVSNDIKLETLRIRMDIDCWLWNDFVNNCNSVLCSDRSTEHRREDFRREFMTVLRRKAIFKSRCFRSPGNGLLPFCTIESEFNFRFVLNKSVHVINWVSPKDLAIDNPNGTRTFKGQPGWETSGVAELSRCSRTYALCLPHPL